jgi:transcriptional regulator with XRE-family HTH domain
MIRDIFTHRGNTVRETTVRDIHTFSWRIKQERDRLRIDQAELVKRIWELTKHLPDARPISQATYSKLEAGDIQTPKHYVLIALAQIFDCSIEYLVTGKEPETAEQFTTPEANQVARLLDGMDEDLRKAILALAQLVAPVNEERKALQTEVLQLRSATQEGPPRIQSKSILNKINIGGLAP